jgi:hypothetical protein
MLGLDGLLPSGRQQVTVEEFREAFVTRFPQSKTRDQLFQRWLQHRASLLHLVSVEKQWINGSFVTAKTDPADIDVVTFFDGDEADGMPAARQALLASLLDGHNTRDQWGVDSFAVPVFPAADARARVTRTAAGYWTVTFSRERGNANAVKGFLEVSP